MSEFERSRARLEDCLGQEFESHESFRAHRDVLEAFYDDLGPEDVVWDVGARGGTYTLFALERLGVDAVVAFEFRERLFMRLREHCADAGYEDVQLCHVPLGGVGEDDVVAEERTDVEPYELETAADVVEFGYAESSPTVLHIDRAGLEPAIIDGFSPTQLDRIRAIYMPIYDDVTMGWLDDAGYEVEVLTERSPDTGDWHRYVRAVPGEPGLLDRVRWFFRALLSG